MNTKLFNSQALLLMSLYEYWNYQYQSKNSEEMEIAHKEMKKIYYRLEKAFIDTVYADTYDDVNRYILELGAKCGVWHKVPVEAE